MKEAWHLRPEATKNLIENEESCEIERAQQGMELDTFNPPDLEENHTWAI